jgi:hypothetical protein
MAQESIFLSLGLVFWIVCSFFNNIENGYALRSLDIAIFVFQSLDVNMSPPFAIVLVCSLIYYVEVLHPLNCYLHLSVLVRDYLSG